MSREKPERSAHDYALDLLSQRAYTRAALERKLVTKGFDRDEVASEIESLERSRLIDDDKYAEAYARNQLTSRRKSVRRVTLELIKKGIASERAKAAIGNLLNEGAVDIDDSLRRLAEKKAATLSSLEPRVRRQRLAAYLSRQGFEMNAIRRVLDRSS